eukprot:133252_1
MTNLVFEYYYETMTNPTDDNYEVQTVTNPTDDFVEQMVQPIVANPTDDTEDDDENDNNTDDQKDNGLHIDNQQRMELCYQLLLDVTLTESLIQSTVSNRNNDTNHLVEYIPTMEQLITNH